MSDLPHLRVEGTQQTSPYKYAGPTPQGVKFNLPPRNRPVDHARKIEEELKGATTEATSRRAQGASTAPPGILKRKPEGVALTFRGEVGHDLTIDGLERLGSGIQLLSFKEEGGVQIAEVFVPDGKQVQFLGLVGAYAASVVLTFIADPKDEAKLKALENAEKGFKFCGPVRKTKEKKIKIKFLVPEGKAAEFQGLVGADATLSATSRRNDKLINSIASVKLAVLEDFWQDTLAFPQANEQIWWEVWLRGRRADADDVHGRFTDLAAEIGIPRVSDRHVAFPERVVIHVLATPQQLSSLDVLAMVAELRKAKELATYYVNLTGREQREFVLDLTGRLVLPGPDAPSVCILDAGVNCGHPLLAPCLAEEDTHAVNSTWGKHDHHIHQHGTGMAGISLYGCLTEAMTSTEKITLRHRLESVKILPPTGKNEPPDYGSVMQSGVSLAFIQAARRNRVICMAVTADDRDMGMPTLWSAAVDDMCAGTLDERRKLMFISAGNIEAELYEPEYVYHDWNTKKAGIEDPGQAWNALTIGAMTEKVFIQEKGMEGWEPIASCGDLCPTSRTSLPWPEDSQSGWPIKPDLVMEGGNYVDDGTNRSGCDDLSLLTTIIKPTGHLLTTTCDTSPATGLAVRMAAMVWSRYPRLWPETVRALLVHTARWTPAMTGRFPRDKKSVVHRCLRCYGYGVPDIKGALSSAENDVTLIFEGELQPFKKEGSVVKTHEMHLHQLPWPTQVLEDLGKENVTMRVTLSYFIEPSPNRIGWGSNHRYQSHGLRFDVIRPLEGLDDFKKRISASDWGGPQNRPKKVDETRNWVVGENGRTHGSLHCDWWEGQAAQLARCGRIAVFPVTGWWKERDHIGRYERKARYSLIVSIKTEKADVDLYNVIASASTVQTELMA